MGREQLVVAPHRPLRAAVQIVVFLLALLATGYLAHSYTRATLAARLAVSEAQREGLAAGNARLVSENTVLRERVAILERAAQVDRKANVDVRRHIARLQNEILALKEEAAFYRGIVSTGGSKGLFIQSFEVERTEEPEMYRYRVVLTQDMKSDKVATGTVRVSVAGEQDGQARRLTAEASGDLGGASVAFQFKHFQRIEGRMELPRGFSPRSVLVRVMSAGSSEAVTERTFDWPEPIS